MRGIATMVVGDADTSIAMGSGEVAVLATPRIVALCEEATCAALVGRLGPGMTSVGMRVQTRPPASDRGRSGRRGRGDPRQDRGPAPGVHRLARPTPRASSPPARCTRVVVDIDKFLSKMESVPAGTFGAGPPLWSTCGLVPSGTRSASEADHSAEVRRPRVDVGRVGDHVDQVRHARRRRRGRAPGRSRRDRVTVSPAPPRARTTSS